MTPPLARLCVLAGLILALSAAAFAQSQATTGNIEGRVLDPKDAALPGASVTATNQQTGLERTATADDQGGFTIAFLLHRSAHSASYLVRIIFLTLENPPASNL